MARRVRDNELAPRGAEITIGNVNGDALLALRAQPVGQQRKIKSAARAVDLALLHRNNLVFVDRLRVVQQAANQRGLAIVHAARGGKPE